MKSKSIILGSIIFSWFLIHSIAIMIDGLTDDNHKADYILILGNTVNPDGKLSDRLKARVDKGLQLFNNQQANTIVVSGGLGAEGHYEGSAMKAYLVAKGVSKDAIILDNLGNNTSATAKNYVSLTKGGSNSVIVVSQFFHITRTKYMLKHLGVKDVYGAHPDYFELRDLYSVFREFFAYYQYLILG